MDGTDSVLAPGERLILVSNRLPVVLEERAGEFHARMASGGLATGLGTMHRETGGSWIGWPGMTSTDGHLPREAEDALAAAGLAGVALTEAEFEGYYQRFSNRCIWPLFHYFAERVRFDPADWETYQAVNRKFADAVLAQSRPEDIVFVQDFHLMLVPQMLREARPTQRIGFFLHIPFPSSEIFRLLPPREELLRGLLGADVVAFHTQDYLRHFRHALLRLLGIETQESLVEHEGRKVRLLAKPLGIEPGEWANRLDDPEVGREFEELQRAAGGRKVILGLDRLDYTKGIPERLLAFEKFLAADPRRRDEVMMIQVAVPSRVEVSEYKQLKDDVDQIAGRINSDFGKPGRMPLHYLFQSVSAATLAALYRLADVALVTPLRDGLNLVAKEYVASRDDDDGVLVLGECTGASWELGEALRVNPYDRAAMARALERALAMPQEDQIARMRPMRNRVRRNPISLWAEDCVTAIRDPSHGPPEPPRLAGAAIEQAERRWRRAPRRRLVLDYDGTLREFADRHEAARPQPEILELLRGLQELPDTEVWIFSGRAAVDLDAWLGATGVGLVAEHGAFVRASGADAFSRLLVAPDESGGLGTALEAMRQATDRLPLSRIEEKQLAIAWHYRACDATQASWQAKELFLHLHETLAGTGLQVLRGDKVIEVRHLGADKGSAYRNLVGDDEDGVFTFVAGDDFTDEDLFLAAPRDAVTLLVGRRPSAARHRIADPAALRALLRRWLTAAREAHDTPA